MKMNSMSMVHEMLYKDLDLEKIELGSYLNELGNYIIEAIESSTVDIEYEVKGASISLTLDQAVPLGLVVNEIITNSIKHVTNESLSITVEISDFIDYFQVKIYDDGQGLPIDFNPTISHSFGVKVITLLMNQMNAKVEWSSSHGAICLLTIPNAK